MTYDQKSLIGQPDRPSLAGGAKPRIAVMWGRVSALTFCAAFWSAVWVHAAPAISRFLIRSIPEIDPILFRAGILAF
jgi:hypothetical protein